MTEESSQSRKVLLQTTWAELFLMLFVDARIYQATERILSHCRNNAEIYSGKGKWNQINWSFCDKIWDFFSIYQIDKAKKSCCRPHELSPSHVICWCQHWSRNWTYLSHCRKDPVIYWGNCQVETNQLINSW